MYVLHHVRGHIEVYDVNGVFLFSADNEQEARSFMEEARA